MQKRKKTAFAEILTAFPCNSTSSFHVTDLKGNISGCIPDLIFKESKIYMVNPLTSILNEKNTLSVQC